MTPSPIRSVEATRLKPGERQPAGPRLEPAPGRRHGVILWDEIQPELTLDVPPSDRPNEKPAPPPGDGASDAAEAPEPNDIGSLSAPALGARVPA